MWLSVVVIPPPSLAKCFGRLSLTKRSVQSYMLVVTETEKSESEVSRAQGLSNGER